MDIYFFIFFLIVFGLLIFFLTKLNEKIERQQEINLSQGQQIQEIQKSLHLFSQTQEDSRNLLQELKFLEKERERKEIEFLERIKRIDEIIGGTSAKGFAGEEILREVFKQLPPKMIVSNFRVGGKVVEFSLTLPNGKKIPIDSKWPAGNLISALENEKDPQKREEIIKDMEREVAKRIREVKQYIDPDLTWDQAICALPDSVYYACRQAHILASRENIILVPYSMALPTILFIYHLYLQHGLSIDFETVKSHLFSISRDLDEMEKILENKMGAGLKYIQGAQLDFKNFIAKIKNSINIIFSKNE